MHMLKCTYEQICLLICEILVNKEWPFMERKDFTFETEDGIQIQAYYWFNPKKTIEGIVQIAHGMVEHALRYEPFAHFLNEHGFAVYANDHRGHGQTCTLNEAKGFLA